MSAGESIELNGVRYVRETPPSDDVRIVVLHRGHVVVGYYSQDGGEVIVRRPSVVRIWGATRGLGEIAAGGPTSKTILDPCGEVRVHRLAVIMSIKCEASKWTAKLS